MKLPPVGHFHSTRCMSRKNHVRGSGAASWIRHSLSEYIVVVLPSCEWVLDAFSVINSSIVAMHFQQNFQSILPHHKMHVTLEPCSWDSSGLSAQHIIVASSLRVGRRRALSHKLVHHADALQAELCHRWWIVSIPIKPYTPQGACHARTVLVGDFPGQTKPRGPLIRRKSLHFRRLSRRCRASGSIF
jgi:hypothetical protein